MECEFVQDIWSQVNFDSYREIYGTNYNFTLSYDLTLILK